MASDTTGALEDAANAADVPTTAAVRVPARDAHGWLELVRVRVGVRVKVS